MAASGTVAAGDVLFIPANMLTLESVADGSDVFGLRWAAVFSRDKERFNKFEVIAGQKMTPSTHISKAILSAANVSASALCNR